VNNTQIVPHTVSSQPRRASGDVAQHTHTRTHTPCEYTQAVAHRAGGRTSGAIGCAVRHTRTHTLNAKTQRSFRIDLVDESAGQVSVLLNIHTTAHTKCKYTQVVPYRVSWRTSGAIGRAVQHTRTRTLNVKTQRSFRIDLVDEPLNANTRRSFRIELVDEPAGQVAALLNGYRDVMHGRQTPGDLWGYLRHTPDANGKPQVRTCIYIGFVSGHNISGDVCARTLMSTACPRFLHVYIGFGLVFGVQGIVSLGIFALCT